MNNEVYDALQPLWKAQRSEFVFSQDDGSPMDIAHMDRYFKRAKKNAGSSEIRFHDLRHTFASQFMMNGGNIYDLQKILGHSTVNMTERYAHLSSSHLDEAIKIVSFKADLETNSTEKDPQGILSLVSS